MIKISRGQNLPLTGAPLVGQYITKATQLAAVMGIDFNDLKVSVKVQEGDQVKIGTALFEDKVHTGVMHVSPIQGRIKSINRGDKRMFQSIVVEREGSETFASFSAYKNKSINDYSRSEIVALLCEGGMWNALRVRPFSKTPAVAAVPSALFITAIDTNPLSVAPDAFIQEHQIAFQDGVKILSKLTEGKTYVCIKPGSQFKVPENDKIKVELFVGPHPAGNVGTHIHFLSPVSAKKNVWHINYQEVVAVGKLFGSGQFFSERWIALGGPMAKFPRVIRTHLGADVMVLLQHEFNQEHEVRTISGSVLHGHKIVAGPFQFLNRFMLQLTLLREEREREFLGWHSPGFERFSVMRTFLSKLNPHKLFAMGTSTHGSLRAIVPIGAYEKVMPLDILATQLLRALASKDTDTAVSLGALELDEEDLALCTFVDPGKDDFGSMLRENLQMIEKEG